MYDIPSELLPWFAVALILYLLDPTVQFSPANVTVNPPSTHLKRSNVGRPPLKSCKMEKLFSAIL
jgi:hypothetical protein